MTKRASSEFIDDGNQAYLKRQKIKHVASSTEDIRSSQQLQQLLTFDQNLGHAKHGIQSFKLFLESCSVEDTKEVNLSILKEYLRLQMPHDEGDTSSVFMVDIMQTWSLASQSNNEALLSAVPAVLALLFRTLSAVVEFASFGLQLGQTLLQARQLELFSRGLASNKSKDYIISPSLRLIREVTSFDGGILAKDVYREKNSTFKALARNLSLRHVLDDTEDPKKPSVRTHALRFLLTCLKFLPSKAKTELCSLRDVISGITRDILTDPPYLVAEVLEGIKELVLKDDNIPRDAKSKLLHPSNLGRVATLYRYDRDSVEIQQDRKAISSVAHEFLLLACTTPNIGVLYSKAGFYPRGIELYENHGYGDHQFIDLGLESLSWATKFVDNVPVRNTILSDFIQVLRPWSDKKQSELLLAIFEAAPELVADYFFRKKSFNFEPKITATWIGYSAFLFSVIQLPAPHYFGFQDAYKKFPPPSSIIIESILPQPLTQKILTRCLSQKSSLITFFAIRLLIAAFQKLQIITKQYHEASETGSLIWTEAESQLIELFCQRCPAIKDIIITFNGISWENFLQRQASSKLLVMYYQSVPQVALESKFDISGRLTETLSLIEGSSTANEDRAIRVMEVENLFEIAHFSQGMRWFNQTESSHMSPFAAMLQLLVKAFTEVPLMKLKSILDSVIEESGIMQMETQLSSQDALILAIRTSIGDGSSEAIYKFIDNCALRCATTPVKYLDMLEWYYSTANSERLQGKDTRSNPVSLLLLTIAEQWPFVVKSSEAETIEEIATFIANYFAAAIKILEDKEVIQEIVKTMVLASPESSKARKTIEQSHKLVDVMKILESPTTSHELIDHPIVANSAVPLHTDVELPIPLITDEDANDHSALTRWITKGLEGVIEEGHAAALIMLLSSSHLSARKEGMSNIAKLALKLKASSYSERDQIWLLLSELMETARPCISVSPLPTTITAFASHALPILHNPLHCLYPKINKFLSQGPSWDLDKFPLLRTILNEPPTVDDAYYTEVSFLLSYLASGLRTAADMVIFHKRRVFEKLLTFYNNPHLGKNLKEGILRVVWCAVAVEGGSTTLITRLSVLSWVEAQKKVEGGNKSLGALVRRLLETCDVEKVGAWSGQSVKQLVAELE